jgi:hypothetical protein
MLQKKSRQRQGHGGARGGGRGGDGGKKRGKRSRGGSGWEYGDEDWGIGEYGEAEMAAEEYGGMEAEEYGDGGMSDGPGYTEQVGEVLSRRPQAYRGGRKARKKRMKQANGGWKEVEMKDAEVRGVRT